MAGKGSLNKVMLIGNMGRDPEMRHIPDGGAVTNFTMATTDAWRDKNTNEQKEATEWHRVVFFGRAAEVLHEYARKGTKIYVEGRLQTRKWQDKEGNDRYTTEIRGDQFTFLSARGERGGDEMSGSAPRDDDDFGGGGGKSEDDIPF